MNVKIKHNGKRVYFVLLEDEKVFGFLIPKGFETDFASVPKSFWNILPPLGRHNNAALLHDWLYVKNIGTRKRADELFLEVMLCDGVRKVSAYVMYWGVRIGGGRWWKAKGDSRVFK